MLRSTIHYLTVFGFALLAAWSHAAEEKAVQPPPARENKIRILLVTGGHDFEKEPFFALFNGHSDITCRAVEQPAAQEWFAADKAGQYDVMVWYDMWKEISDKSKQDLLALLDKGKPLVVLHHAVADYQNWPEAIKIIGGKFYTETTPQRPQSGFKHGVDIPVKIADRSHPITRFMSDFQIHDETYKNMEILPSVAPLLVTDHGQSDTVIGWTHRYRRSPVVYIQLGHDHLAYEHPAYRRLVTQAIRWAAGRLPAPCEEGYVPLFDGKSLDGWSIMGDPAAYHIADGVLRSDLPYKGEWLRSNRLYGDFILRVDWRVSKEGNSGVFVRTKDKPAGYPWETGSEIQITSIARDDAHCTGSLYGSVAVDPRPDESPDVWHHFEIQCRGPGYKVFADNIPVIDVDARAVEPLYARPLLGYVGVQDNHSEKGWIEYRNIRIKELTMVDGDPTPWKLGAQAYTFNRFTLFEAIDKAKSLGLKYVEIYPGQRLSPDEPNVPFSHDSPIEALDKVKRKLAEADIKLVCYGVVSPSGDEAATRKIFEFARLMGIETITAEPAKDAYDLLDRLTREYGINVAIHNHPRRQDHADYIYWNPDEVLKLIEGRNPRIGVCADTGHWLRSGLDPVECLKKLQGRIISLHLKDLNEKGNVDAHDVHWGEGAANVKGVLEELRRQGFRGAFSIEYEHNWENNVPDLAECIKYFTKVADELGCGAAASCPRPRWDLGVQVYTFRKFTLLETLDKVRQLGLSHIEAYSGQRVGAEFGSMLFDENSSAEARAAVKKKLGETGIEMAAYYFHNLGADEGASRKVLGLAKEMGVKTIVCEPPADRMALVDKLANEYGVDIAIHQHVQDAKRPNYVYWNPNGVLKALEGRSGRIGACPDTGHWTRSGINPIEALKAYQGRIKCVHLKDINKADLDGHDVVWGTGVTNMAAVMAELRRQGFAGVASIEYEENPEDNMAEVAGCIRFHNKIAIQLAR